MTTEPTYILRTTRIHVVEEGKALDSSGATILEIGDAGYGKFILMSQVLSGTAPTTTPICINDESEWNAISAAVQDLFADIKRHDSRLPKEEEQ